MKTFRFNKNIITGIVILCINLLLAYNACYWIYCYKFPTSLYLLMSSNTALFTQLFLASNIMLVGIPLMFQDLCIYKEDDLFGHVRDMVSRAFQLTKYTD